LLRGAHVDRLNTQELADTAGRIVDIAHPDRFGGADLNTSGLESLINSMGTEIAFCCRVRVVIYIDSVVRARLHAHLAADAQGVIEIDDAVGPDEQRLGGAASYAWRISAVVAPHNAHLTRGGGVLTLIHIFHPRAKLPNGNIVFGLAGHRAGMATNTGPLINGKAVAHEITSSECRNEGRRPLRMTRSIHYPSGMPTPGYLIEHRYQLPQRERPVQAPIPLRPWR